MRVFIEQNLDILGEMGRFYTYIHVDPTTGAVRYVGKGQKRRAWQFDNRYGHHKSWLKSIGRPKAFIMAFFDDKDAAYEHEREPISSYRLAGVSLCNATDGGEGGGIYGNKGNRTKTRASLYGNKGNRTSNRWSAGKFGKLSPTARLLYRSDGKTYGSATEAGHEMGFHPSNMLRAMRKGKPYHGFLWSRSDIFKNDQGV